MVNVSILMRIRLWNSAQSVDGYDSNIWRKDFAGAWIRKDQYNQQTKYGWGIENIIPRSNGGTNTEDNLIPLHWQNGESKGNDFPVFYTVISSLNNINIFKRQRWQI